MTEDALRAVADRQEITELLYRYCRAVDRIDPAFGYPLFHEDAVADYGDVYQGDGRGAIDFICNQHKHTLGTSHQVTNVIIQLDGDRAASEAYATAHIRVKRDDQLLQMTVLTRYLDVWSRRGGRWGVDKRVTVMDFDDIAPVTPIRSASGMTQDRNDPSYSVLKEC